LPARDQYLISCSAATELQLPRRQLILGLVALPALAASAAVAADQSALAVVDQASVVKTWDAAEKYLTELAGLDFGYKDVSERLDKIARLREDDGPSENEE